MEGRVRKRGNRWYYSFEVAIVNGKRKRVEKTGYKTKKEALEALRKSILEYENAGSVLNESEMSVSDYFDYWFNEYVLVNCKPNTQVGYKRLIKNHIKPKIGIYKLKKITPAKLQELINDLEDLKIITLEQYNTILKRFPYGNNMHVPLQIGFNTGMRVGEVMSLTWDCIDIETKTIKVEKILYRNEFSHWVFGTPKTNSSYRTIKIGDTLTSLLKRFHTDQKANRLRYGELLTTDSLKYLSRVVNYELNIPFKFHSLRHTHATMLLEAGANIKDTQERLGHSKSSITMDVYSHVTKKMSSDTVSLFETEVIAKLPTP